MNAKTLAKTLAHKLGIPRSRRGSVLVLIVGVLAMVALLVLVYSTLGQADKRGAESLAVRTKLVDQANAAKDYFARTIGDSTFNYVYQKTALPAAANAPVPVLRAMADYPYTDPEFRTTRQAIGGTAPALQDAEFYARRFNPTGQVNGVWTVNNRQDPRRGVGQPWLASSEPSWIRPYNSAQNAVLTDITRPALEHRDWLHISNFAPSGNFVNLFMLRQNPQEPGSGFDVISGVGDARFTNKLTLRRFDDPTQLSGSVTIGGASNITRADRVRADLNRPYDWSAMQVGVLGLAETNNVLLKPGNPGYLWSEWVDADGDGNPDSRPFEMVDVSDAGSPQSVIALDPNYRWVFAARAIDLSGRVNVNTAWQHQVENNLTLDLAGLLPTAQNPWGQSPADTSLSMLLESPWLYNYDGNGATSYAKLTPSAVAPDYDRTFDRANNTKQIAGSAYAALLQTRVAGTPPLAGTTFNPGALPTAAGHADIITPANASYNPSQIVGPARDILLRRGLENAFVLSRGDDTASIIQSLDPATAGNTAPATNPKLMSLKSFGLSDLLELMTYNGANNPATTSQLELTLDGRNNSFANVGVLRSNRDKASEIAPRDLSLFPTARKEEVLTQLYTDVRSRLTTLSGARPLKGGVFSTASDPNLSAISESDLRVDIAAEMRTLTATTPDELGLAVGDWSGFRTAQYDAANRVLNGYANALMPFATLRGSNANDTPWQRAIYDASGAITAARGSNAQLLQPLAFGPPMVPSPTVARDKNMSLASNNNLLPAGFSTAELALRRSAHMVMNLWASRDIDMNGGDVQATGAAGGTVYNVSLSDEKILRPVGPSDEIVAGVVIFNENQIKSSETLPGPFSGNVFTARYTGNGPRVYPFAGLQATSPGRQVTSNRTIGRIANERPTAPEAYVRGTLLNLDIARANRDGTPTADAASIKPKLDNRDLVNDLTDKTMPHPVTVFGIKPQPFITAATTYVIYTDTPTAQGGDDDFDPDPANGEEPKPESRCTINGDITTGNKDFIGQMLIITITNPFDTDISLVSDLAPGQIPTAQNYKFYFEFAGRRWPIAYYEGDVAVPQTLTATTLPRMVLQAKSSMDFFVLAQPFDSMVQRFKAVNQSIQAVEVKRWIESQARQYGNPSAKQFTNDATKFDAHQLFPMNDAQQVQKLSDVSGGAADLLIMASQRANDQELTAKFGAISVSRAARRDADRQVLLWRAFRESSIISNLEVNSNRFENDILVDRLRDPQYADATLPDQDQEEPDKRPALCIQLPTGNTKVDNTKAGREADASGGGARPYDNTGISIALYASIQRPRDLSLPAIGTVPSYCIESKISIKQATGYGSMNEIEAVKGGADGDISTSELEKELFFAGAAERQNAGRTLRRLLVRSTVAPYALDLDPNKLRDAAKDWVKVGSSDSALAPSPEDRVRFRDRAPSLSFAKRLKDVSGVWTSAAGVRSTITPLRLIDVLRPLAIGPSFDPLAVVTDPEELKFPAQRGITIDQRDPTAPINREVQWTTLSEALAVAVDADSPASPNDVNYYAGDRDFGSLDRGQLPLTRFVPFHDFDLDGIFTTPAANNVTTGDVYAGAGVPFGMDVLNQFRTLSVGGTRSAVNGVMNINTASQSALRSLPLGFMPTGSDQLVGNFELFIEAPGTRNVAVAATGITKRPLRSGGGNDFTPEKAFDDLGSQILAYRDKTRVFRPVSQDYIDFRDLTGNAASAVATQDDNGRRTTTQILALRETPGFASVGELLAVRSLNYGKRDSLANKETGFDYLGRPMDNIDRNRPVNAGAATDTDRNQFDLAPTDITLRAKSINSNTQVLPVLSTYLELVNPKETNTGDPKYTELSPAAGRGTYESQLLAAGAMLNSVSVRSDVYAVWFTMDGYKREDTQLLNADGTADLDAPLVPSVRKRYLMVLDRSNVTQKGQLPRILMFQDLPVQ